jgi:radical SAM protein with 4Fe4S-binding SPASM domain
MRSRFAVSELQEISLSEAFSFTQGIRPLKIPGRTYINAYTFGTMLFDLATDPGQEHPMINDEIELRMTNLLVDWMHWNDAPGEQFERLGLPAEGKATCEHLLCAQHYELVQQALRKQKEEEQEKAYDRVMAGLTLLKQHQVEFNVLTCVHAANADHPLEVYRFLHDEVGTRYMQFLPIVERMHPLRFQEGAQVSPRSVNGEAYGHFLNTIFDEWVQRDVGQVCVQMFDVALAIWLGEPAGLCIFDETCGRGLAMEHNGDVYSCDHFVEPRYHLGNMQVIPLAELAGSVRQRAFGFAKRETLPRYCRQCPVAFACHGGCPKDRFIQTPDGESGLNYLCAGYKAFFTHVDTPMKLMSALIRQGRPATDVMTLL